MKEREAEIDKLFASHFCPQGPEKAQLLLAYLMQSAREGHLCVALDEEQLSHLPDFLFDEVLVQKENRIYLRRNWECEQSFLTHLARLQTHSPSKTIQIKSTQIFGLNPEQEAAVHQAAKSSLTLISGGPGTGKTFTAAVMIRLFLEAGLKKIAVAAPTGKATANLRSALLQFNDNCQAQTLHSLLKKKPIDADLVLIDEGSMVDAELMEALFSAVKTGSRLILLGDRDQLPPVDVGHFFGDLARNPKLTVELKTCLRAELKQIIDWASAVKRGEAIPVEPLPDVKTLVAMILEKGGQVLTPLRKGLYGSDYLNQCLLLEERKRGATEIPILITVNDSTLELYNGDTGILHATTREAHFSAGRVFPEQILPPYEYAYALSVHKSQGSEYDSVIVLLPEGSESFGREMLYTAITRAKKEITILAHPGILEKVIQNRTYRLSGIC